MIIVLDMPAAEPEQQATDAEHEHGVRMLKTLRPEPDGWICGIPVERDCQWSGEGSPCQGDAEYVVAYSDRVKRCVHVSVCEYHCRCIMGAVDEYHARNTSGALTVEEIEAMYAEAKK